jgi:hypothetical protein
MRKKLRSSLTAAALAILTSSASLAFAAPASAHHTTCPVDYICFYEHINFNHERVGWMDRRHVAGFHRCRSLLLPEPYRNDVSSVYNNTDEYFDLWDVESSPSFLIGTTLSKKGYGYLGARGNDELDLVVGNGCL